MKSKISFSRSTDNRYIRNLMKERWWVMILLAIGFMLAFPVRELASMEQWRRMSDSQSVWIKLYDELWKTDNAFLISGMVITFIAALLNGINEFWYLFSSEKVDFYHSLPVKRKDRFRKKAITGTVIFAIPYLAMELIALFIGFFRGFGGLDTVLAAGKIFLMHLLIYELVYFTVVLAFSVTGNLLSGALALIMFCFYGPALGLLICACESLFYSQCTGWLSGLAKEIMIFYSPFSISVSIALQHSWNAKLFIRILICGIIMLVILAVAAYLAYEKRKVEKTGKSLIYDFLEPVITFLTVIPAALGIGCIFVLFTDKEHMLPWWIFGLVLGTILFYGILQVVFDMDFRSFFTHKIRFVIICICVFVSAWVLKTDQLHFGTYMPDIAKIDGIGIELINFSQEKTGLDDYSGYMRGASSLERQFTDAGISEEIYQVLQKIASGQKSDQLSGYGIQILYRNKSGINSSRQYTVTSEDMRDLLKVCYEQGTLKKNKYKFLDIDEKYLIDITYTRREDTGEGISFGNNKNENAELMSALRADYEEATAEELTGVPCGMLELGYNDVPLSELEETAISAGGTENVFIDASCYVFPTFKRTLAFLEKNGYADYTVDENDMKGEELLVFSDSDSQGDSTASEDGQTVNEQQAKELEKAIFVYYRCPNWVETLEGVSVQCEAGGEIYNFAILEEEAPEFVKEALKEHKEGTTK